MNPLLADVIGLTGSALFIGAFTYANVAKELNKALFNALNLGGAVLLLISLWVKFNLAAFVLETAWAVIALMGLVVALRKSPSRSRGVADGAERQRLGVGQPDTGDTLPPPAPPASGRGEG